MERLRQKAGPYPPFVVYLSLKVITVMMAGSDVRPLHAVAILIGTDESEAFLRLSQSPIGDECQRCHVCRSAREYVQRRLDERSGRVLPPDQNGDVAWRSLRTAVESAKASIHESR
jgi:hypothetical protein